ncbi:bacteriocin [Marinifilum caeruleilacunae]|jgi:bacteriocin-like protein|uniref:Bacteriocin n=1 Tax=Marinifilum caeruleilacunae TaxID=2499076 RepID=A0ABX1X1S5_9BACT|nr:bacteriocin [Marinifilum caeruleilacunae]NOU62367.1 bacteriocin [Marinifilum caeruleilacunae]
MTNLEKFKVQKLTEKEMQSINGGVGWLKELIKGAISGELVTAVKEAYNDALEGYVDACANGTYDGIPGCRR